LTREESKASYAIIRHNIRTYESGGVVLVVKGKDNAEVRVKHFEAGQSSEDRHAGWRYFIEQTDLKVGMDPAQATHLRQMKLEIRESQAGPDQVPAVHPQRQN
jgi:hypothetical protein